MYNDMINDVIVDVEQITKTIGQLGGNERLPITITVFKPQPYKKLDEYYYNTIRVRYPNLGREKGDPREIEFLHTVWCNGGFLLTKNGRDYVKSLPDIPVINELIANYQQYGDVTLIRNDLNRFSDSADEMFINYPDGSKYNLNMNKVI